MGKIKKFLQKIKMWLLMSWYVAFYNKDRIEDSWILIDSKNGKDLGSNMLRIAEELTHNLDYQWYRVFLSCGKGSQAEIARMAARYRLGGVTFIRHSGFRYARVIALSKYLFTDTSFPMWYTKKNGQIITNTWHGTPLKAMGKDVGNRAYDMGNVQKSHLTADYLIYPNKYMRDVMVSAYFLTDLYPGKILYSGYPRNSVFYDTERAWLLRIHLGLDGKKLYGYMPTWRGVLKRINFKKNVNQAEYFLTDIDRELTDDEIFFVRLHPFINGTIDYSKYQHIRPFPESYDPYDIMNLCDCMVTDYSSIFFDYANTRRKLVLFVYDKELYMDERGTYLSIDSFPFPQVRKVDELIRELRTPKEYDDTAFVKSYCTYDGPGVPEKLCRHIIKGEKVFEEFTTEKNGRENVLIYSGNLGKSGLTTSLMNLFSNIDLEKRNYFVTFRSQSLQKAPERVGLLPPQVRFYPMPISRGESLGEGLAAYLYYYRNVQLQFLVKKLDRYYKRLYRCNFGECKFNYAIHFTGYEKAVINLFGQSPAKRFIFVHNDMIQEMATRHNQHEPTISRAYREFERVIPVTEDIYDATLKLSGNPDNIRIVNNCHDYRSVREKSKKELEFDADTSCTVTKEELGRILDSGCRKIVNIGRFSPEKGHSMLLKAFEKYFEGNPDSYLIIIGGHGAIYKQTLAQAETLKAGRHIVIIQSISNPMPILKKCDLFVLSSLYEGLGLVILEADTLRVPVISTDVPGPRGFMKQHGGYLVPASVKGLYDGMLAFDRGEVKAMDVDYQEHNHRAVRQFEELF